ncbi:hypothetical protein G6011_05548 [Alternaria panax]|uniref:6-phosphogluconate dehydrogenase C-terminal domain-like protein n=1 Tax=Alternaria panax TaxID=48097 RepID=A0AAD4I6T9_9PLEO|nr:hypothetical protein G6011_05548 [Alternaria panax]
MSSPHATVAILSIGQMGLGIAQLLKAHDYRIITNISARSRATQTRAESAGIELFATDEELVAQSDYILSIVPPRDAVATAKRVEVALAKVNREGRESLYYLDLNATSPTTTKSMTQSLEQNAPDVRFIDGGIIGGSPSASESEKGGWQRPGVPLSGPDPLHLAPVSGAHLAEVLNTRYLGAEIGTASGLKCCFAALSKGFTALALQSFTTASSLGVLNPLLEYMDVYNVGARQKAEKSVVGCTSKAYRWVEEMNQIGECFDKEGGWKGDAKVFREIAGVFQGLADIVEREGKDSMGNVEGVVEVLGEGLRKEKR